jgi:hypothetical protein
MPLQDFLPRSLRPGLSAAALTTSCLALSCGGDGSTDPDGNPNPAPVATVEFSSTADTLAAGATTQLAATVRDADGNVLIGRTASWESDNTAVATVDASGLVTAIDQGTAAIQVTVEEVSAGADITVVVGVTGTWEGTLLAGTDFCPLTQSVTETLDGAITGSGAVDVPCTSSAYVIVGMNDAGGVADSVYMFWNGSANLTLDGPFDGSDGMAGFLVGGGCVGTGCPYTMTRTSIEPAAPSNASPSAAASSAAAPGLPARR